MCVYNIHYYNSVYYYTRVHVRFFLGVYFIIRIPILSTFAIARRRRRRTPVITFTIFFLFPDDVFSVLKQLVCPIVGQDYYIYYIIFVGLTPHSYTYIPSTSQIHCTYCTAVNCSLPIYFILLSMPESYLGRVFMGEVRIVFQTLQRTKRDLTTRPQRSTSSTYLNAL